MDKKQYVEFIEMYENDDTKKIIGKLDINILKLEKIENLYYTLPLIERLVVEIYKLSPGTDIECYNQGIIRTPISIIVANRKLKVLPRYLEKCIKKYYKPDGIRNRLFHIENDKTRIKVNFKEINFIIMKLLKILRNKCEEYNDFKVYTIELL